MNKLAILIITALTFHVYAHDKDDPKPVPPPVVAQPQGDDVHHESRTSKLAKVVGVAAAVGLVYHLTWGAAPSQTKQQVEFGSLNIEKEKP